MGEIDMTHEELKQLLNEDILQPHPDPSWDYYSLWEELSQIKDDVNALINFISDYEHTSDAADTEIKDKIDILVDKLEAARELV